MEWNSAGFKLKTGVFCVRAAFISTSIARVTTFTLWSWVVEGPPPLFWRGNAGGCVSHFGCIIRCLLPCQFLFAAVASLISLELRQFLRLRILSSAASCSWTMIDAFTDTGVESGEGTRKKQLQWYKTHKLFPTWGIFHCIPMVRSNCQAKTRFRGKSCFMKIYIQQWYWVLENWTKFCNMDDC